MPGLGASYAIRPGMKWAYSRPRTQTGKCSGQASTLWCIISSGQLQFTMLLGMSLYLYRVQRAQPHQALVLHMPVDNLLLPFFLAQRVLLKNPAQNTQKCPSHAYVHTPNPMYKLGLTVINFF